MFKWIKDAFSEKKVNEKNDNSIAEKIEVTDEHDFFDISFEDADLIEDFTLGETIEEITVIEDDIENQIKLDEIDFVDTVEEVYIVEEDNIIDNSDEKIIDEMQNEGVFGFFKRVFTGLEKTRTNFTDKINEVLGNYMTIGDELYEDLEDILITADVGVDTTIKLINNLRDTIKEQKVTDPQLVIPLLAEEAKDLIKLDDFKKTFDPKKVPTIILVVGVNGVGKTTTIGKLAHKYKMAGKKVLLVAADTFRAAATEQLQEWAKRSNVDIVHQSEGSDPAAVVFDAIQAAKARDVDIVLCDTAGRLHNKANLMNELEKIYRIIDKNYPEANKESLVVLDATTGQNALLQAREFKEVSKVTGIVITKLDGTAKGGIVLPIIYELQVPVVYVGVGEKIEDLQPFDSNNFVNSIFGIDN